MKPIRWLSRHEPGFRELSGRERNAVMHFSLLWSLFESGALNTNGNARAIVAAAKLWADENLIAERAFHRQLAHFRNRYHANGAFTYRFEQLGFRPHDRRALVEQALGGDEADPALVAAAVLIIVYRLRNNLFHGVKWADGIRGQLENFDHANEALMQAIALYRQWSVAQ